MQRAPIRVTNVDTVKLLDGAAATAHDGKVTLHDNNATYTSANSYQTITVDASALTKDTTTIIATAEQDGKVVIKGGGAADAITLSASANFGDDITGGAGNDVITFTQATLTKADTIAGGDGTDTLINNTDGATIADAAFTNVSGVEVINGGSAKQLTSLTIDAKAYAAGVNTVTLADTGAVDRLNIGKGFAGDLTVNLDEDTTLNQVVAKLQRGQSDNQGKLNRW